MEYLGDAASQAVVNTYVGYAQQILSGIKSADQTTTALAQSLVNAWNQDQDLTVNVVDRYQQFKAYYDAGGAQSSHIGWYLAGGGVVLVGIILLFARKRKTYRRY